MQNCAKFKLKLITVHVHSHICWYTLSIMEQYDEIPLISVGLNVFSFRWLHCIQYLFILPYVDKIFHNGFLTQKKLEIKEWIKGLPPPHSKSPLLQWIASYPLDSCIKNIQSEEKFMLWCFGRNACAATRRNSNTWIFKLGIFPLPQQGRCGYSPVVCDCIQVSF